MSPYFIQCAQKEMLFPVPKDALSFPRDAADASGDASVLCSVFKQ